MYNLSIKNKKRIHRSNFGRVSGRGGTLFSVLLVLRWETAPLLNFCLIYVGNSLSKDSLPELYGIACNRDASVAELLSQGIVLTGMSALFNQHKIRSWTQLHLS